MAGAGLITLRGRWEGLPVLKVWLVHGGKERDRDRDRESDGVWRCWVMGTGTGEQFFCRWAVLMENWEEDGSRE